MHANSSAVARTLANHAPANASDLAALVIDHLRTLIAHVRGDDTNSLRQFWRADEKKRQVPEIENTCRDAILGMLRPELMKLSVQLEKEASAANDTRADLRAVATVDSERVVVPIEIKKQEHKHLWTAWRDQLDGRYLTDPAAQGIGVYLVLWFGAELGAKLNPKSSSTGERPRSAGELESMLRSVIPPADRIRLSVVVLDLSLPVGPM